MEFDPTLVHEWLSRSARRLPDKTALVCEESRYSYAQLDRASSRLSLGLVRSGLTRGDRVVIFLENSAEAVISLYGVLKAGAAFVVAESMATATSLRHMLTDSGARFLISDINKSPIVEAALSAGGLECTVVWVDGMAPELTPSSAMVNWRSLLDEPGEDTRLPRIIDIDLAALIYTSGSTGRPKGIMSTHHNMGSAARSIIQYIGNEEHDVILNALPLAFDYGLYQVIMTFMFGGTIVLERSMGFLEPMIRRIENEGVTGLPIVPSMGAMLLKMKRLPCERLSSLRYITNTGALWPAAHIRQFRRLLPKVRLFSMYGLTECKRVGFLPPERIDEVPESVGQAMPNTEASVVDETGKPVQPGEVGELVVRGSNVMQGYWNDRPMTERTFKDGRYPADRYLSTGDWFRLGRDGLLYFVGRRDDLIKSFGRRVSPREVEDIVSSMSGIVEAAIIGVPDEVSGQVLAAFIVVDGESPIDEGRVKFFCGQHLEPYKVPRYVRLVDSLPKTSNGKVDKKRLATMAAENPRPEKA